ncbi:hypothetical protein R50072_23770 [Simiduia litorea]|uniref:hypothetical protein n=1 Tax=Simiduia litorea TaxID=1435348 RepID=UPI0036F2D47D
MKTAIRLGLILPLVLLTGCMSAIAINNQDNENCQQVEHCSNIGKAISTDIALTTAIAEEVLSTLEKPKPLPARHHAVCDIETQQKICSAIDGCRCAPLKPDVQ